MKKHYRTHVKVKGGSVHAHEPHIVLARALREKFNGLDRPVLIAVGGPGGIGKSTFAGKLARELGHAVVLGLDDYKTPREFREGKKVYGPHPDANEIQLLHSHLQQLRRGESIEKPCYCRQQGKIHATTPFAPDRFVIIEGEIATYREFYNEMDFSIFIDSHWETQLNTRIRRDIEQRGYTPQKAIATFLYSNLHEFEEYGMESKNWADVHIHCEKDYRLVLDAVCSKSAAFIVDDVSVALAGAPPFAAPACASGLQGAEDTMNSWFEELDYQKTPMGDLILQRRRIAALNDEEAYEVKLGDEYLMSSLFHEAEVALTEKALSELGGTDWDVVVGGLGLGYTAAAALRFPQVKRLIVVEALEPVIAWHRRGLVPNGHTLSADPRCVYHHADFFSLARGSGFDPDTANQRFDAILLDIDHTPTHVLSPSHADFYTEEGLRDLTRFLKPGGVFGLWSNEAPDEGFLAILKRVFARAEGHLVRFDNPLQQTVSSNGIYIARVVCSPNT